MAALVSSILKSTISRVVGVGKDLPGIAIGEKLADCGIWAVHSGTKRSSSSVPLTKSTKDDGAQVSVFMFDLTSRRDKLPLAANAFKRMRTIRHPEVLRFIDGMQNDSVVCFATEPVRPLLDYMRMEKANTEMLLLGLYKIANAINFLNKDCKLLHCNVRPSSIFVTRSGEWKLGVLEVMSSLSEEPCPAALYTELLVDNYKYMTPEARRMGWRTVKDIPIHATDVYQYACLSHELFNGPISSFESYSFVQGSMPQGFYRSLTPLLAVDPKTRTDMELFLVAGRGTSKESAFFNSQLVPLSDFLENITIYDVSEREKLVKKIDANLEIYPVSFAQYKILPALLNALEYGSASPRTIVPVLKIGKHLSVEEYEATVVGAVVKLFASPDRIIRVTLLESLNLLVDNVSSRVVSDKFFPNLATGFTDPVALVRDQTIKAVLLLAPKLSERLLNNDLLRYLGKCQTDEEPGIRTNATVCVGRIAPMLNEGIRKKVLASALSRSLRDPFPPARVAGLNAFLACAQYFSIEEIACRALPTIVPLTIDLEKSVRDPAFVTLHLFVDKLEKNAKSMPEVFSQQLIHGNIMSPSSVSSPMAGGYGNSDVNNGEGWASWMVSNITKTMASKLVGIEMEPDPSNTAAVGGSGGALPTRPMYNSSSATVPSTVNLSSRVEQGTTSNTTSRMSLPQSNSAPSVWNAPVDESNDGWNDFDFDLPQQPKIASNTNTKVSSTVNTKTNDSSWNDNNNFEDDPWGSFDNTTTTTTTASTSKNATLMYDFPVHAIRGSTDYSGSSTAVKDATSVSDSRESTSMAQRREEQRKRMAERKDKKREMGAVKM